MNPQLKALHDKLAGLIADAKTMSEQATIDVDAAAKVREEIDNTKAQISAIVGLQGSTAQADEFLNGRAGSVIQSITGKISEEGLAHVDTDKLYKATKLIRSRGSSPFLSSVMSDGASGNDLARRFGYWLKATGSINRNIAAEQWCDKNGIDFRSASGATESVNEDGGYLVPEEFADAIIVLREKFGVFRRYADVVPMSSDVKNTRRRTGGLTAYFKGEGQSGSSSKTGHDLVKLVANKLYCLTYDSSELDEDAMISWGDMVAGEMAYAFAKKEDQCGFGGDGTSTYGGIVGVRQKLVDAWTTSGGAGLVLGSGNAFSELTLADHQNVDGALPEYAEDDAAVYCHRKYWASVLMKLALAAGGVPAAEIMMGGQRRFLGYEVRTTQVMPSTDANSQIPFLLGSLRQAAMLGNRRGITIVQSIHDKFAEDEIGWRGTERFDINVHSVVDPFDSTAAGPMVGLLTAAS